MDDLACGRGETLEQYAVYENYLSELELYLDEFATSEGYDSAADCFNEMNDLVLGDKEEREKAMKELAAKMKESFEKWAGQFNQKEIDDSEVADAKADSKTPDDDVEDLNASKRTSSAVRADAKGSSLGPSRGHKEEEDAEMTAAPPVIMFFQPVSLESMIQHVLNLTEYTTFSHIMRTKVRQRELFRLLQAQVDQQLQETRRRQADLDEGLNLLGIFDELVDRICGLTPHQKVIQEQVRRQLRSEDWSVVLQAGELTDRLRESESAE